MGTPKTTTTPTLDFKALAREIRGHGIAVGQVSGWLLEDGQHEPATTLSKASTGLSDIAERMEAWRHEQERFKRVPLSAAAVLDTLQGLDLHHAGLMRLAETMASHGLQAGDVEQVQRHARALEDLREDLALSVPEPLGEPPC